MKKLKMFLAGLLAVSLLVACSDDEKKEKKPVTPPEPVEAVTFTPAGGEVESGATVTLATATEGASIYYVFGGKAVDLTESYATDGTLYTAPVAITEAGVLSAVAVKDKTVSTLTTADYTIAAPTETPDDANDIKDGLKDGVTAYWVSDVDGLKKLSEIVNGGNTLAGYTFVVKNDIQINKNVVQAKFLEPEEGENCTANASYVNLDSIGMGSKDSPVPFSGIFDGNNKVVDGFYAYQAHQGLAFFGCISGAKIKNVILTNACVINSNASGADDGHDDDRVGGLIGDVVGESSVKGCVFTGVVGSAAAVARGTYEYIGGLVGRADAAIEATNCIVFAKVYGSSAEVADIICKKGADKVKATDVTGIDAATYTEGAYTGDNAYVLAAIALLNKEPLTVAKAVFTTAAGEVAYGTAVEITCETEGAEILYKVGDGEFAAYDASSKPVVKAESVTITAYTVLRDENNEVLVQSAAETVTYTVAAPAAPVIDPNGGDFVTGNSQTVTITTETAGAFVVYKFGEVSENTADYTVYDAENKPVVSATSTIVAVAVIGEEGAYITSDPVTAVFTFTDPSKPDTPAPVIASEAVLGGYNVTITCTDTAAAIYYSKAAFTAEDITSATLYADAFKVEDTATIYALSVKEGANPGSASLEITVPELTLTIAPEAGGYLAGTPIEITADDGATITYKLDDGEFATYDAANKPKITAVVTVTAKAEKAGFKTVNASATYTVRTDIKGGIVADVKEYIVSDVDGLKKLAEIVNEGNALSGYTFVVANDITINESVLLDGFLEPAESAIGEPAAGLVNLDSIGKKGKPFSGTFDGNNKVIRGLYIYQGHQGLGFFGSVSAATIKNVILLDACVVNKNMEAGSQAEQKDSSGIKHKLWWDAEFPETGTIPKLTHDGSDDDRFGGLIGLAEGESSVENFIFSGVVGSDAAANRTANVKDVNGNDYTNNPYEYIGGLVGRADKAVSAKNCTILARVYGSGDVVCSKGTVNKDNVAAYDAKDKLEEGQTAVANAVAAAQGLQ